MHHLYDSVIVRIVLSLHGSFDNSIGLAVALLWHQLQQGWPELSRGLCEQVKGRQVERRMDLKKGMKIVFDDIKPNECVADLVTKVQRGPHWNGAACKACIGL